MSFTFRSLTSSRWEFKEAGSEGRALRRGFIRALWRDMNSLAERLHTTIDAPRCALRVHRTYMPAMALCRLTPNGAWGAPRQRAGEYWPRFCRKTVNCRGVIHRLGLFQSNQPKS